MSQREKDADTVQQPTNGELVARVIMGGMVGLFGTITVLSALYFGYPHPTTHEAALLTVMAVFAAVVVRAVQRFGPKNRGEPMTPELDEDLQRLKRRAYDTEADASMSLRAGSGPFRLKTEVEDGATLRVDDISDEYLALVGFMDDAGSEDSTAYFQIDIDEARELAAALEAAADLHEGVRE